MYLFDTIEGFTSFLTVMLSLDTVTLKKGGTFPPVYLKNMTTSSETEHFTYTWKVENFSSWVQKRGERVKSPWFLAHTLHDTKWRLDLYPRGIDNGNEICISCYLCRAEMDDGDRNVTIGYEFDILGADGSSLLSKRVESFTFKRKESLGWPDFKSLNEIFKEKSVFLPKDSLTIRCHMWGCFPHNLRANRCSAMTETGVGGCSFKWSVKVSALEAPVHYFVPGPWRIELTFFVNEDENICLKIRKFGEVNYRYTLLCKIVLLDVDGVFREVRQSDHLIEPKQEVKLWEFPPFLKKSRLVSEKIASDDTITFLCEFSISNDTDRVSVESPKVERKHSLLPLPKTNYDVDVLREDLDRLLHADKLSDVVLETDTRKFYVHKAILSTRSSTLAELFERDNSISVVDMTDLTEETMSCFLKYIYTGELDIPNCDSAKNLFIAASKYKVQSLKNKCSAYLKSTLCGKTICGMLNLAYESQEEDLKSSALEYIKEHTNEILLSKEWKSFVENDIELATEVLCKLSIKIGTN